MESYKQLLNEILEKGTYKPATIQQLQNTTTVGIHFMAPYAGFEPVGQKVITHLNQVKQHL